MQPPAHAFRYVGLLPRSVAFALDYLPIALYLVALTVGSQLIAAKLPNLIAALFGGPWVGQGSGFLLVTVPVSLYFVVQEASPCQATWGKRWGRLQVITMRGQRLTFARALARTALKFVPWELAHACIWQARLAAAEPSLLIVAGFVLVWILVGVNAASVALRSDHRALYDLLAGTAVVRVPTSA